MRLHEVIEVIQQVLNEEMQHQHMELFHEYATLAEDLNIDSVGVLQLLLHIEISTGIELPEDSFSFTDIGTVRDLAELLIGNAPNSESEETLTDDVTVHCLVSCFCDSLKKQGIDFRPMYFGVWDVPFYYEDGKIKYHKRQIDHSALITGFENLYGAHVVKWYDYGASAETNIDRLERLITSDEGGSEILAMIDLSRISGREHRFYQKVFPHYVMLKKTEHAAKLQMLDPDFRWQGEVDHSEVVESMLEPSVAGGYMYQIDTLRDASSEAIALHFDEMLDEHDNVFVSTLRQCLEDHCGANALYSSAQLGAAVKELPLLAIRKYAYEHAFAYYWLRGACSEDQFDLMCEHIEALVKGLNMFHYLSLKYSVTAGSHVLEKLRNQLNELDAIEFGIKGKLRAIHNEWVVSLNNANEEALV